LRPLAGYPKSNAIAVALREIGRIERSIFNVELAHRQCAPAPPAGWAQQRRGPSRLKSALCLNRRGEFRDRARDGQSTRAAGLNFLAAAVIHHNAAAFGRIVADLTEQGAPPDPDLLADVSPPPWGHIRLTEEYRWRREE
jgi:TnpA family transposase